MARVNLLPSATSSRKNPVVPSVGEDCAHFSAAGVRSRELEKIEVREDTKEKRRGKEKRFEVSERGVKYMRGQAIQVAF